MPKVNVSFKQTSRDTRLYTAAKAMEEQSDFIKDAIEFYLKHLERNNKNKGV